MSINEHQNGKEPSRSDRSSLLDLPGEILSQIASLLPFLSLNSVLLSLTRSHLSPLPSAIRRQLDDGPPYAHALAVLPSLTSFVRRDDGHVFLPVLVRAKAGWIVERFESGRWDDDVWEEAFDMRFLKSWKRYKKDEDSWRAVFLRMLGRLEHRTKGCTHEEAWTRFVTLHRNGSTSINRIYSRMFDPYEIYDELKHQNNFSSQPTQVRVLLHLQDVRIIALGVLHPTSSLFTNPNAHLLLHPPLLRDRSQIQLLSAPSATTPSRPIPIGMRAPLPYTTTSTFSNEAYFPLVRSISPPPSTAPPISSSVPLHSPSLRTTFSNLLPGRNRRVSVPDDRLTAVRSRDRDVDEGRKRTWSFGRNKREVSIPGGAALERTESNVTLEEATPSTGSPILATLPEIPPAPPLSPPR
ncbi:hypothetical protein P7C73_g2651, partial [Tremellales sp. Uapishka_1]